jgi:hypothetical protein
MKRCFTLNIFLLAAYGLGFSLAQAQQETAPAPSLGDLAQKQKANRSKAARPAKVFTNDNLPARPPEESPTAATGMSQTPGDQLGGATGGNPSPPSEAQGEQYFRTKMSLLEGRLEEDRRQLNVLEQKLSQNQMQYYPDPNKALQQEYSRSDITKLNQDIDKKKQEIAGDQKAIDDLQGELRRVNGDPGWLRGNPPAPIVNAAGAGQNTTPETTEAPSSDKKKTREYWQARFASARSEQAKAKEAQQLVEDELNLLQIQQARLLDPAAQSEVAQRIAAKRLEVDAARAATATAQKNFDALERMFNESGAPQSWSKTE